MIKFKHIPNITTLQNQNSWVLVQVHPPSHSSMDGVLKFREGVSKASRVTTKDILCIYFLSYTASILVSLDTSPNYADITIYANGRVNSRMKPSQCWQRKSFTTCDSLVTPPPLANIKFYTFSTIYQSHEVYMFNLILFTCECMSRFLSCRPYQSYACVYV